VAVGLSEPVNILAISGITLATTACGIKSNGQHDLVLIKIDEGASCAAVFTQNAFCAAPVTVAKKHLSEKQPRALLINSGNANAGTGEQGVEDALQSCDWLAEKTACSKEEILPFSTGVIGETLPMASIEQGIQTLSEKLLSDTSSPEQWQAAARGIMTTDTVAKAVSKQVTIDGKIVTITGIAKGSGMICPNMATMLAFIGTDANVGESYLAQCLHSAVGESFNAITVDGDTSTNDACVLVATGQSDANEINADNKDAELFLNAVSEVCVHLAQAVIRDAEGATKFVEVNVKSAASVDEARDVAYTIAHSPLVKTALFASDPNWGRILAAVGRAGIEGLVLEDVSIYLDEVCIVSHGSRDVSYTEAQGQKVMDQSEIAINVNLNRGDSEATIWTSDLSHEYVTINSEYRT